jgi:hypothetical protein
MDMRFSNMGKAVVDMVLVADLFGAAGAVAADEKWQ